MRGTGRHIAPSNMQPIPADNTESYVRAQVTEWKRTGVPIHTDSAREIASWYHSPSPRDYGFAAFASTGTLVTDDDNGFKIIDEIDRDVRTAEFPDELEALRAYVRAC